MRIRFSLALLICVCCLMGCGQNKEINPPKNNIENNTQNASVKNGYIIDNDLFPDSYFCDYIKHEFDKDNDGILSETEILEATEMIIDGYDCADYSNIKNIQGIEYFSNLNDVRILHCSITNADFSKNPDVRVIVLMGDSIKSVNVAKNYSLETLWCWGTSLSDINVSTNYELKELNICGNEEIIDLNLMYNSNLEMLDCSGTNINKIDISENKELCDLEVSNTCISELDLKNNPKLQHITCNNTEISTLDVSNNPELLSIYCICTNIDTLDLTTNLKVNEIHGDDGLQIIGRDDIENIQLFSN